jgi:hypothetical protein
LGRIKSLKIISFAIYDITNPTAPVFITMYKTGEAPEGLLLYLLSKALLIKV